MQEVIRELDFIYNTNASSLFPYHPDIKNI
jgi:hypothetical protein